MYPQVEDLSYLWKYADVELGEDEYNRREEMEEVYRAELAEVTA